MSNSKSGEGQGKSMRWNELSVDYPVFIGDSAFSVGLPLPTYTMGHWWWRGDMKEYYGPCVYCGTSDGDLRNPPFGLYDGERKQTGTRKEND